MKKTLTINLNGIVHHIDEDAYRELSRYLENIGRHFASEEKEEIMKDIEARVAELFAERLQHRTIVEMEDVQYIIDTLGRPEQFGEESTEGESARANGERTSADRKRVRRLYRDSAHKRIGGVAAGMAAFLDWDIVLVRILFIVALLLSVGWALFIYLVLWLAIPEASSVAQRLEMQGVEPTVENISNFSQKYDSAPPSLSGFAFVLKIITIAFLCIIGLALFSAVLGVFIAIILLMLHLIPAAPAGAALYVLLGFVAVFLLCPAIAIVMSCRNLLDAQRPRNRWMPWVLLGLWLISLVGIAVSGTYLAKNHKRLLHSMVTSVDEWMNEDIDDMPIITKWIDNQMFDAMEIEDGVTVRFTQGDTTSVSIIGAEEDVALITTQVRNGVLYIQRNSNT